MNGPAEKTGPAAKPPVEAAEALWRRETLAALGGMAEEVAHQVRNPLGSIELMASLLLRDLKDEAGRRRAGRILSGVREIESRIAGLLSASWRYGFSLRPLRLNGLLAEIFQSSEQFADGDDVFLEIRYGAGDPEIRGDRAMLRHLLVQMVLKILSALSGGGRLVIETAAPVAASPKEETAAWVKRAVDAGIRDIWIHQGTDTPEAVAIALSRGLDSVLVQFEGCCAELGLFERAPDAAPGR